jgi:hypothetical protein
MRTLVLATVTLSACAASAPPAVTMGPPPTTASASATGQPAPEAGAPLPADGSVESTARPGRIADVPSDARADSASLAIEMSDANADRTGAAAPISSCNDQAPQDFLIRGNFLRDRPSGNARAIQYRTDQYGYFSGYGHPSKDAKPPSSFVEDTVFMGLSIRMHRKVVPALKCVEQEIQRACSEHPYTPHALAGIRYRNTYRGGEVTNHAYGIAIDIDPSENSCCGCVKPWSEAPLCKRPAKTEYDRMRMPECWVHAFERYGFYWLGHDALRDTMHFEFLGDPERILKSGDSRPATPAAGQ